MARLVAFVVVAATLALVAHVHAAPLCDGIDVDNTGTVPIGNALQRCLEQAQKRNSTLIIKPGVYSMNVTLTGGIGVDVHVEGAAGKPTCVLGGTAHCATFRAHPSLDEPIFNAQFLSLHYVVVDGNRAARPRLSGSCHGGKKTGMSAVLGGGGDKFERCAFINAVCGAGLYLTGSALTVTNSYFANNGDYQSGNQADGLSVEVSEGSILNSNTFVDNTASAIALGGGAGLTADGNIISMQNAQAYSGLTLDTLHGPHSSEFYGATFKNNKVDCRGKCGFGILIGSKPLNPASEPVRGGDVHNNTVSGAVVNINVDAGDQWSVFGNHYQKPLGHFTKCPMPQTQLNISPDSKSIDRKTDREPHALKVSYAGCL